MELNNKFTKEQLIERAQSRAVIARAMIESTESPDCQRYYRCELALNEIAMAALSAVPVGYINRHTGVFHKPEGIASDGLELELYFPVFGGHPLLGSIDNDR